MRTSIIAIVALLLSSIPAHGQSGNPALNYDFEHPLYTVVDVATKGWFSGWSGDCNSGRVPSSFMLWRVERATRAFTPVPSTASYGPRPDAAAYLAAVCGRPFDNNVGWSLVPNAPEPAGEFLYVVLVTDLPTSWSCGVYPAGYPNAGQQWCDFVANAVYRIVK